MTPGDTAMAPFAQADLPSDVSLLPINYQWKYSPKSVISFEVLWQALTSQEHRLGQIGKISLTVPTQKQVEDIPGHTSLRRGRLRAILKVCLKV